jgi:hypothetical protein
VRALLQKDKELRERTVQPQAIYYTPTVAVPQAAPVVVSPPPAEPAEFRNDGEFAPPPPAVDPVPVEEAPPLDPPPEPFQPRIVRDEDQERRTAEYAAAADRARLERAREAVRQLKPEQLPELRRWLDGHCAIHGAK